MIALRRLLIGEARTFPALGDGVLRSRARAGARGAGVVRSRGSAGAGCCGWTDPRRAAAQFAYLVAGEPLDRAMLVGTIPPREHVLAVAREGVQTFLARYGTAARGRKRRS